MHIFNVSYRCHPPLQIYTHGCLVCYFSFLYSANETSVLKKSGKGERLLHCRQVKIWIKREGSISLGKNSSFWVCLRQKNLLGHRGSKSWFIILFKKLHNMWCYTMASSPSSFLFVPPRSWKYLRSTPWHSRTRVQPRPAGWTTTSTHRQDRATRRVKWKVLPPHPADRTDEQDGIDTVCRSVQHREHEHVCSILQ